MNIIIFVIILLVFVFSLYFPLIIKDLISRQEHRYFINQKPTFIFHILKIMLKRYTQNIFFEISLIFDLRSSILTIRLNLNLIYKLINI